MTRDSASWDRGSRTPLALLIVAFVGGVAPAPVQSQDGPAFERHSVIGEGSAVDGPTFWCVRVASNREGADVTDGLPESGVEPDSTGAQ